MKITEVAFVGYPVTDLERARDFYGRILGLEPGEVDQPIDGMPGKQWIEYAIGDQTLAISNAWEPTGQSGPSVALEVEDLDAALRELRREEVPVVSDILESPVCRFVLIRDFDGNDLTLHQRK